MSRTIRLRKASHIPWWANYEWRKWVEVTKEEYLSTKYGTRIYSSSYFGVKYEKEVDNRLAFWETHKDQRFSCKEPGPSWFRNLTSERPQRREAKRQLNKFLYDSEFEVLLDSKTHLEYYM